MNATTANADGFLVEANWQRDFAGALLDSTQPLPKGLRTWNHSDATPRFAVHRNNVFVSLERALAETFPVVQQLVGEEFFGAMARCHIAAHPPRSPVLVDYGDEFAGWLESFEPATPLPYLADVARLERSRVRATHAADAVPLSAADAGARLVPHLAAPATAERVAASRLELHPSLTVVTSPQAAVSLWAAHHGHGRIEDVVLDAAEAAVVLRQGDARAARAADHAHATVSEALTEAAFEVVVLPVSHAAARFVRQLQDSATLAEAAAAACEVEPDFALDPTLALLIAQGAVVDWILPGV